MDFVQWGALAFGLVVGWITYRTLVLRTGDVGLSDISTVIGVVGGAAITGLFEEAELFAAYSIGLAIGFFSFILVRNIFSGATMFMMVDTHAKK